MHFLTPWLLPPGIQILLTLFGLAVYRFWPSLTKLLILLSVLTLWLASTPAAAYYLIDLLQNRYHALQLDKFSSPSFSHGAIVILGGGDDISIEENHKHTVSETTLNRLRYGAYLFKKLHLPIIVSGGRGRGSVESEADLMLKTLQHDFAIASAIKEDKSQNTAEESMYLAPLLKSYQFDGIYLVTNAWHMPRSVATFERAGIRLIPAPMGYKVYDHNYTWLSYLPSVHALEATSIALHEILGLLWYDFRNM